MTTAGQLRSRSSKAMTKLWNPTGRPYPPAEVAGMRVLRQDRLGGLIREYAQVA